MERTNEAEGKPDDRHWIMGVALVLVHSMLVWMVQVRLVPLLGVYPAATELILFTFGISACLCAGYGALCRRRALLVAVALAWAAAFYVASILLAARLDASLAGLAMRVGALATAVFLAASALCDRSAVAGSAGSQQT